MLKRRDRSRDVSNVVTGNAKGPTMQGDVGRYKEIQGMLSALERGSELRASVAIGNAKRAEGRARVHAKGPTSSGNVKGPSNDLR